MVLRFFGFFWNSIILVFLLLRNTIFVDLGVVIMSAGGFGMVATVSLLDSPRYFSRVLWVISRVRDFHVSWAKMGDFTDFFTVADKDKQSFDERKISLYRHWGGKFSDVELT